MNSAVCVGGLRRWRISYGALAGACAGLVALADFLFYRHVLGWTAGLFLAALVALIALRGGRGLRQPAGALVLLLTLGLVAALVEHPSVLALVMSSLALGFLAMTARGGWQGGAAAWLRRWGRFVVEVPTRLLLDNRLAARWLHRHPRSPRAWTWAPQLWLFPLALGAVFVALFTAANPIISGWLTAAWYALTHLLDNAADLFDGARMAFWVASGAGAWALLRAKARKARRREMGDRPDSLADLSPGHYTTSASAAFDVPTSRTYTLPPRRLTPGVVVRCLATFNALFAVQTLLDLLYLWGGAQLPDGMTWAEYAQRGAYPLVATALLAAVFVLVTFRAGAPTERLRPARWLVYGWVAQNVLLVASAGWRLSFYVNAFSLTRLRLAAGVWMVLVAAGLLWIVWRLLRGRSNAWLLHANVLTTLAVLYAASFMNFDGFIADYNVRHCRETAGTGADLDVAYLRDLGPEALPALRTAAPHLTDPAQQQAAAGAARAAEAELRESLSDWRSWTYRRHRLARALSD